MLKEYIVLHMQKKMKTRGSLPQAYSDDICCISIPPLTPLAYLTMFFVPFISMVLGNAVTLRQITYARMFEEKYGQALEPLPDTSILQNVELPSFTSRLAMRDWVNVLAALWCTLMFLLWCVKRNYVSFTTFLASQTFIVPIFALSQWMTIVPDSDPKCLSSIDVPDDGDWIWYRISLIQCGDMMWSSAIVQTILFSVLGFSGFKSRCVQAVGVFMSTFMLFIIATVAWMALYQYACDIILSMFVTVFISTHPFMRSMGLVLFYTEWELEDSRYGGEKVGLMTEEYEEEFGIEDNEDDV